MHRFPNNSQPISYWLLFNVTIHIPRPTWFPHDRCNVVLAWPLTSGFMRDCCKEKTKSVVVDSSKGVGLKGRMSSTTDRYRAEILDGHRDQQIRRLWLPRHSHSEIWIWPKRGRYRGGVCESAREKRQGSRRRSKMKDPARAFRN